MMSELNREDNKFKFQGNEIEYILLGQQQVCKGRFNEISHRKIEISSKDHIPRGSVVYAKLSVNESMYMPLFLKFIVTESQQLPEGGFRVYGDITQIDGISLKIG